MIGFVFSWEASQWNEDHTKWAVTCDFQQYGILTSVDSDEPVQPPFKLQNFKWCSASSLTLIEYSSDKQRRWSDCAHAKVGLSLCWSHIPHCWKSLAWVPVWSFFLLFYLSVPWSKMTAWGTLISIDSATWIFPQILWGKAKNDNAIG